MTAPHAHTVLIIDFGSQVTQLIARRVRETGVYCEIHPFQNAEAEFLRLKPDAVILSGGPASVTEANSPRAPDAVFKSKIPVLGICYGQQTMAEQLGGKVESGHHREFGRAMVEVREPSPLYRRHLEVWRAASGVDEPRRPRHRLPEGFKVMRHERERALRRSPTRRGATMPCSSTRKWCTRRDGAKLLGNFVHASPA
jgi:GMP synthase (glutamine-hydrolysing)